MPGNPDRFSDTSEKQAFTGGRQIRLQMLRRLALISLCLAALTGFLAYYLEMREVDRSVNRMAIAQADSIIKKNLSLIRKPDDRNRRRLETNLQAELISGNFQLIEIYNQAKEEIAEAMHPGVDLIDQEAARHGKELLQASQTTSRFFATGGQRYVQVFTGLSGTSGQVVGYFEGLYKIPRPAWEGIMGRVYRTVAFIVLAVLGVSAILYPIIIRLNRSLFRLSADLSEANLGMLVSMGAAIAKRDSDTDAHNYRVTILAVRLARELNLPAAETRVLIVGSFMHDVGKVAIADAVLLKPGRLNDDEWKIMKTHVNQGVDVVREHEWLAQAVPVVHGHHEKYDGSGYPRGLTGEEIPLVARIFALADVFDALSSKRPYKEPFPLEKCLAIIEEARGSHFDPDLVEPFIRVAKEFQATPDLENVRALKPVLKEYLDDYFGVELG